MSTNNGILDVWIRRLLRSSGRSAGELEDLLSLEIKVREFARNETIVHEGSRVDHCLLVLEGFVIRTQETRHGKRQILSFYVPGDIPDLQTLHLPTIDHSIMSITPTKVAFIPHGALKEICNRNRLVRDALWRETLIDAAVGRAWLRCVGRLPANARLAHILCELYARLDAVGLATEPVHMPITQAEFGDAVGLSVVQINMSLRNLREAGLISVKRREMIIYDLPGLQRIADFNPLYLHLDPGQRR